MCADSLTTKLLPLASAVLGFIFALILFSLKEKADRAAKIHEAKFFLLFFLKIMASSINARIRPASTSGFDEAIKKLATARLPYYTWNEMNELNDINSVWISGGYIEYSDISIPLVKITDLASRMEKLIEKQ